MIKKVILTAMFSLLAYTYTSEAIIDLDAYIKSQEIKKEEPPKSKKERMLQAIIKVESDGNIFAYNEKENAAGILQIRPTMLREVNRILGKKIYKLEDRYDSIKSIRMFMIFQKKHNPEMDLEMAARMWNGGDRGMRKTATIKYYEKVRLAYGE